MKKFLPILLLALAGCSQPKDQQENLPADTQEETVSKGQVLLENSDCQTCHHTKNTLLGPSYSAVAERYQKTDSAVQYLAKKIINGGAGQWGDVPMLPHPDITKEEAEEIAQYVMSFYQK